MKSTKQILLTAVSVIALSSAPALFAQDRHDDAQAQRADDAQEHRADNAQHASEYRFRQEDSVKLRQHYKNVEKVDIAHRQTLAAGGQLPAD